MGKGSFATVRKGRVRATGEKVAVKIISKRKMNDDDRSALQNEIDILKQVDHPNIVKMFDVFEDDKYIYIVMELLGGGELFDQILKKEKFSELEARDVVAPIFDALTYCHQLGIVHRDIKPENLLFSSKDTDTAIIKITDFGLARFVDGETFATTTCGTPGYVAPEILSQKPYKEPCDYWSVGVVLYILLSGQPPFYDDDNFELFEKIKKCKYDMDSPIWGMVSSQAKDLISKLLVADPAKRITGEEIAAHPWILGEGVKDKKGVNVLQKMREWDTKRKMYINDKHGGVDSDDDNEKGFSD